MTAPEDDPDLAAAELVLGLVGGEEAAALRARWHGDARFAAALDRWQRWAASLADAPPIAPSDRVWRIIAAKLPGNDNRAGARWRAAAIAASLVAALLGLREITRPGPVEVPVPVPLVRQAPPPLVAVLAGKRGVVSVSLDPQSGRLATLVHGIDPGRGAVELWVIPADGRPRALGVLPQNGAGWRQAPRGTPDFLRAGATLAVSLEPAGGSPTGLPTGPVVATGTLQQVG